MPARDWENFILVSENVTKFNSINTKNWSKRKLLSSLKWNFLGISDGDKRILGKMVAILQYFNILRCYIVNSFHFKTFQMKRASRTGSRRTTKHWAPLSPKIPTTRNFPPFRASPSLAQSVNRRTARALKFRKTVQFSSKVMLTAAAEIRWLESMSGKIKFK